MTSEREPERVRAPNIRDVAALAGVSYQTVSRVLNDSPSIRDETRQRVLDVIERVGYRPNQAARALVTSRTRTIGVLSSQTAQYGPTTSVNAIEQAAREAGYRLSITTLASGDRETIRAAIDHLVGQAVEAIVVIAPQAGVADALAELSIAVPFVALESTGRDAERSLSVDQIAGARLATRHLVELGHRSILHLAGPGDWVEAAARERGFLLELEAHGLAARRSAAGDWSAQFGYRAGLELLGARSSSDASEPHFTAVFAGNDQMALGFIHACRELGLDVPGDISIVGFDDIPEAAHFAPPLTTVRQDFAEIGRRAVALLLSDLDGAVGHDPGQVAPELVVRASTGAPVGR